jgi:serine/threonine protein kinase/tetratricopeptide (TPR) repeat protein
MANEALDEKAIFNVARQIGSPDARAEYLRQACETDSGLRDRVQVLLHAFEEQASFLESPPPVGGVSTIDQHAPESQGAIIGEYKLLEEIGDGGMGTVWMAEQSEPVRRRVAVKLVKPGMDSKQVLARFNAERQALAMMDHPNIAKVHDAGTTTEGRPFFVMELVKGVPITKFCDDQKLTPRQRLELFVPVCLAIQHAHQKGIIHRDIKPSNVLVAMYDDRPVPKVIDFGVAKATGIQLTEQTLNTGFGAVVGTVEYMSPEQAGFNQLDIDTRSDIYSLGVLLYELLTGTTPLTRKRAKEAALLEMLRLVREEEPPKPSTRLSTTDELPSIAAVRGMEPARLSRLVRGDLDWIVMKALDKDRSRRYETANGFAADVQRYLSNEVVAACPPTAAYRMRKFARRNRAGLTTAGLAIFFVVLLGGLVGWGLRDRAAREAEIAQEEIRKLALTEQGIRQALDRAAASRTDLHSQLRKPGGVQELINRPDRWELFLKATRGELIQAQRLAAHAGINLDAELTQSIDRLDGHLASDQADYDMALQLEQIRADGASQDGTRWDARSVAEQYRRALAGVGVLDDDSAAVAARLGASPIKEQFVAVLDDWAFQAFEMSDQRMVERLLTLARQVAPDPIWGDRLRQLKVWRDPKARDRLLAETPPTGLSPQLYALVALKLIGKSNPARRESWLRRGQAEHPADFWLNAYLATALWKTNPGEALGFARAELAVRPDSSMAHNDLGRILVENNRLPEALACFHKSLELNPKYALPQSSIGVVLERQENWPGAIAAYRKATDIDSSFAFAYGRLGLVLRKQNNLPEAVEACSRAIALDSSVALYHHTLGLALKQQNKPADAVVAYLKAIELDSKDAKVRHNLGVALMMLKKLDEAIASFTKAIEIDPRHAMAHDAMGIALKRQNKLDVAVKWHKRAIDLDPKNADFHRNLGLTLSVQKKWNDAAAAFRESLRHGPIIAATYNDYGWVLAVMGRVEEAIAAYEEAICLKGDDIPPHGNLAWLLAVGPDAKYWDGKRAVELMNKVERLGGKTALSRRIMGLAHYRAGNWKESIAALEEAIKLAQGGDSCEWFCLAMAHHRLGNSAVAREWYDKAVEWMDRNKPADTEGEFRRSRAEAANLLGVAVETVTPQREKK